LGRTRYECSRVAHSVHEAFGTLLREDLNVAKLFDVF
jgi:hypothetical protein